MSRRKMNIREKMKAFGVTLSDVAQEMPENNYPQICNILNQDLNVRVHEVAERLCEEKKTQLRSVLAL